MTAVVKNTVTIVRKATIGFSEVESKVIGATTNAPRDGIPCVDITTRAEIASMSFDDSCFEEITHILLQRLKDKTKWRRVLKALIVLHYCLQEGSPRFEAFCRFNLDLLTQLVSFEYTWHENCDCGLFIRREAREIITLLSDPGNLGNIHRHSASVRKKRTLSKSGGRKVVLPREKARTRRTPSFTLDMLRAAFSKNNLARANSRKGSDTASIAESELNCAPVTMRQKVRHALLEDEVVGEMMVNEIKEIAAGMHKVHDFKDILEALVECTNVAHRDWDCVLKALLLLHSCFCNVYGEVEAHFSDRPDLLKTLFDEAPWANGMNVATAVSVEVTPSDPPEEPTESQDPLLQPFPFTEVQAAEMSSGDLKRAELGEGAPPETHPESPPVYTTLSQAAVERLNDPIGQPILPLPVTEAAVRSLDTKTLTEGSATESNALATGATGFGRWARRLMPQGQIDWTRLTRFNIRSDPTSETRTELQNLVKQDDSSSRQIRDPRPLPTIPLDEVTSESPTTENPPPYASSDIPPSPISEPPLYESLSTRGPTNGIRDPTANEELEYESEDMCTAVESTISSEAGDDEPPGCNSDCTPVNEEHLPNSASNNLHVSEFEAPSHSAQSEPSDAISSPTISEAVPLEIPLQMVRRDTRPVAGGGFGDVFMGTLTLESGSTERIAIKVPRAVRLDLQNPRNVARLANRVHHEMRIWGRLHHQNIVPLRGYSIEENGTPNLISPWYGNGNVRNYISTHPTSVCRYNIMKQMARGLLYLHSQDPPVAHGDLKAANVLVDREGNVALTDFGLSRLLEEESSSALSLSVEGFVGSVRWCAPERLLSDTSERTLKGDIWAFACLCLEIFSGRIPYFNISNEGCVISNIIMGKLPSRSDYPEVADDDILWTLLNACWKRNPDERPSTQELVSMIERMGSTPLQGTIMEMSE